MHMYQLTPLPQILVVDKEPENLTLLTNHLNLDGYPTQTALSGKEALALFRAEKIGLVILDLVLPDLGGIQVCRAIRAVSHVPIIVLTAKHHVSDKVLGLENGADDYLVKPFDYLELSARIKARLRRQAAYQPFNLPQSSPRLGDFHLDIENRQVRINNRSVQLTGKEFDILFLLFRYMGKVVPRETIRKAIWPQTKLYPWSRTIDVHIQHLRAKLASNPTAPNCIVTIQGIGYKLKHPRNNRG